MALSPRSRNFLPWLAGAGLLAVVFWRVPLPELQHAIGLARLEIFGPVVAAACAAWFLLDALAFGILFSRFNVELTFSQARELRGLTYLLTPIHWNVARAGVIARLHSSYRVPLIEATSSVAFYQTLDAILLSTLCWLGLSQLPIVEAGTFQALASSLEPLAAAIAIGLATYLVLVRSDWLGGRLLTRIRSSSFHRTHRLASWTDIATLLGLRLAYYGVFVVVYAAGSIAFGLDLPLALIVAGVPILQCVGALPISPAGLGTQQATMLVLFGGYGSDASIVAFGLALPLACVLFRSGIGASYLRRMTQTATEPAID